MKHTLDIDGMHCASCVQAIEKQIKKLPNVQEVVVNLVTEQAFVTIDDSTHTPTLEDLIEAVKKAGYSAFPTE